MVAFAFKNIYFHLFYQVHGMSGDADTPNLRQFPLIPLLLSFPPAWQNRLLTNTPLASNHTKYTYCNP